MQLAGLARRAVPYLPVVAVLSIAIIVRALSWLNNDSSELITVAEQFLDGVKPYVGFREVNPPASLLLYVPAILFGRWLSLPPEEVLAIGIFLGALGSLWLAGRILRAAALVTREECFALAPPALAILLILPEVVFGQREHMALIAMLPMLASYAARSQDQAVSRRSAILAGIGGGIAASIKPHFALALLLPLLYAAWRRQRRAHELLSLFINPENATAAAVVACYALVVAFAFPQYVQFMLPILTQIYIPARLPWTTLLRTQSIVLVVQAAVAIALLGPREFSKPLPLVLGIAAAGFLASVLIQGKGWPYHGYPAIALMLFILCVIAVRRWPQVRGSSSAIPWSLAALLLIGGLSVVSSLWFWPLTWYPQLVSTVSRTAPPHPKIASLCGGTQFLFPLVRIVQGTPVDDVLWVNDAVFALRRFAEIDAQGLKAVQPYIDAESRTFNRAIAEKHPDVLIVCPDWREWAMTEPEYAHTLSKFRRAASLEKAEVWLPK